MQKRVLERNEICPVCGKKAKRCTGHGNKRLIIMAVAVVFLLICLLTFIVIAEREKNVSLPMQISPIRKIVNLYMENHNHQEDWWLSTSDIQENDIPKFIEKIQAIENLIKNQLRKYAMTTPLASRINENFNSFALSVYVHGASRMISVGQDFLPPSANRPEICFISRGEKNILPSLFFYKADWPALMIAAINYPEVIFSATLFHELGHALYHLIDKRPSALIKDRNNRAWIEEEVTMHELEHMITNAATDGKFFSFVDEIIGRKKVNNFSELILSLQTGELLDLDRIIGCEKCGIDLAGLALAEYLLAIGFRYVDKSDIKDKLEEKIKVYQYVVKI